MKSLSKAGGLLAVAPTSDEDLTAKLKSFVQDKEAFSPNTWRQLLSVMRICFRWSLDNGRSFLPMAPADMRDYLTHLHENGRASSTVSQHASMIAMLHRNAGLVPPNVSPEVSRSLKKINRISVINGEKTGQAIPFKMVDLLTLDEIWMRSPRLIEVRNLAFLHVAYSTLLRVSELARIKIRDLQRAADDRFILDVGYTKTIVDAGGLVKALSSLSSQRLTEWIEVAGLANEPDAYLFCRVHRVNRAIINTTSPLTTRALETIYEEAWSVAGNDEPVVTNKGRYSGWTGHSARVGAAQDMSAGGVQLPEIMREGTWRNVETVMRYLRNQDAHKGAMINLMEKEFKTF